MKNHLMSLMYLIVHPQTMLELPMLPNNYSLEEENVLPLIFANYIVKDRIQKFYRVSSISKCLVFHSY